MNDKQPPNDKQLADESSADKQLADEQSAANQSVDEQATAKNKAEQADAPASQTSEEFTSLLDDADFLAELEQLDIDADELLERNVSVSYLMRNRYLYIYFYDRTKSLEQLPGEYIKSVTTQVGFTVHIFQYCVILTPGELTFAEYGNWGRAISSMQELLEEEQIIKSWAEIGCWASNETIEANVWAEAKLRKMNVVDEAPTDEAAQKYRLLKGVYGNSKRRVEKAPGIKPKLD